MSNNYHTQLDKQHKMNETTTMDANNQMLQYQMHNFQGTPINKGTPMMHSMPSMHPMPPMPPMHGMYPPNSYFNPQFSQPSSKTVTPTSPSELELTEEKIETPPSIPAIEKKKINDKVQKIINTQLDQPEIKSTAKNVSGKQIPMQPHPYMQQPMNVQYPMHPSYPMQPPQFMPPQQFMDQQNNQNPIPPGNKNSKLINYLVIPILLIIMFIILVHPTSSGFLNRYLPAMIDMKGYAVRGAILAILYVIVTFFANR